MAVSHIAMYRCLFPQAGRTSRSWATARSPHPLEAYSVLNLGTAECVNEPCLLPYSLMLPELQVGESQNCHSQDVFNRQAFRCHCCHT